MKPLCFAAFRCSRFVSRDLTREEVLRRTSEFGKRFRDGRIGSSLCACQTPTLDFSDIRAAWFLATGIGDKFAGIVAGMASTTTSERFFYFVGGIVAVATLLLALLVPWLRRATARAA